MRVRYRSQSETGSFILVGIIVALLASWGTHIIWIIRTLASDQGVTGGQILLGILGAIVPPVGIIHGVMIWFGM